MGGKIAKTAHTAATLIYSRPARIPLTTASEAYLVVHPGVHLG
jgi:hypothetical protein